MQVGRYNRLQIERESDHGLYLSDRKGEEVLLPNRYVPKSWRLGELLEVFVHLDSEDRLVATTQNPLITLNQFACLKVKDVNKFGAFMDWGLPKDLFVPFKEQSKRMQVGEDWVVYLYADEATDRLAASAKLSKFFSETTEALEENEEVSLLPYQKTELGWNCVVNNQFTGLLFDSEIHQHIGRGKRLKGFVKAIREDGKLDLALQKQGYDAVEPITEMILLRLAQRDGFLALSDKSPSEAIMKEFEVSKKLFKKAIGALYKQRKIDISKDGITLR